MIRYLMARVLLLVTICGAVLTGAAQAQKAALFRGMTELEIIEALGEPDSEMGRASKKILKVDGVTLELRLGRLYSVDGMEMDYVAPDGYSQFTFLSSQGWTFNGEPVDNNFRFTEAPEDAPPSKVKGVSFYRPDEEEDSGRPNVTIGSPPPSEEEAAPPPAPVQVEPSPAPVEPIVEEEPAPEGFSSAEDYAYNEFDEYDDMMYYEDYEEPEPTMTEKIVAIAIRLLVGFVLTVIIIKIAFENKGFPVLLPQLLMVSGIQALVSLGLDLGFEAVGMHSWAVEQGVEFISLSVLIYFLTDVQQSITAMSIALIARTVTFVVNYLIMLALVMGLGYMM